MNESMNSLYFHYIQGFYRWTGEEGECVLETELQS